jgi:cytochrome P450
MDPHRLPTPTPAVEGQPGDLPQFLHDPVGCMARLHAQHGDAVFFRKGAGLFLIIFAPEYNRQVLCQPETFHIVSRFPGPKNSSQRRFGRGLFSLNGEEHQQHRRLLMPPFRKGALPSYHDALVDLVEERLATWVPGQVIDLIAEMKEFTLRMTTRLLFGVTDDALAHGIEHHFEQWLDLNHVVSFSAQLPIDAPAGAYEQLVDVAKRFEGALQNLVADKVVEPDSQDVLALLLRARAAGAIGDEEVIAEALTTFNAAYHTTTYALAWNLFLLAQHPEYLRRIEAELRPLAGAAPTAEQLAGFPLLERATREGMRLLPPVVFLPRLLPQPATFAGQDFPAGTMVVVSTYVPHHREDLFSRPNHYDPDRWLKPTVPYSYIPFGGGHRLCIGAPFAQNLFKIALALILQRFRLEVVPGACINRHGTLTLGATEGVPVIVHRQDHRYQASPVAGNIHEMVELPFAQTPARAA